MRLQRSQIKIIIDYYKQGLAKLGIRVQDVILFGSYARGRQHADSDIDLIVVSNDFQRMNLRQRLEILGVAAVRLRQPIEAKGYTKAELKTASPLNFLGEALATGISF